MNKQKDVSPLGLKRNLAKRALKGWGWVDIQFANTVLKGQVVSACDDADYSRTAWTLDSIVSLALGQGHAEPVGA